MSKIYIFISFIITFPADDKFHFHNGKYVPPESSTK